MCSVWGRGRGTTGVEQQCAGDSERGGTTVEQVVRAVMSVIRVRASQAKAKHPCRVDLESCATLITFTRRFVRCFVIILILYLDTDPNSFVFLFVIVPNSFISFAIISMVTLMITHSDLSPGRTVVGLRRAERNLNKKCLCPLRKQEHIWINAES